MVKRQYKSPLRAQQTRQTRAAVMAGAHEMFVSNGYASTSIRQIADQANVSEQTVYRLFRDKPTLLREVVLAAVGGPDDPSVARESELMDRLASVDSPAERLTLVADWIREGYERGVAELEHVVWTAALSDPRVAELAALMETQRYEDTRSLVLAVFGEDPTQTRGFSTEDATDYIYAVESSHVHRLLVHERSWTTDKYIEWFIRMVHRMFLDDSE